MRRDRSLEYGLIGIEESVRLTLSPALRLALAGRRGDIIRCCAGTFEK
jgi:hypothetical protein